MFKFHKASDIEKLISALECSSGFYEFLSRNCTNFFLQRIYRSGFELRQSSINVLQDFLYQDQSNASLKVDDHRIRRLRESYLVIMRMYKGDELEDFIKELIYTEKLLTSLFSSNLLVSRRSDLTVSLAEVVRKNRRFQSRVEAVIAVAA